jgi:hypothetical protein
VVSPLESQFLHTVYNDGTFESICKECFHTVARVSLEADLEQAETDHVCDPWTRSSNWRTAIKTYFGP